MPYFCWLLVARATCARKHINLIATICCLPAPLCVCYSLAVSHFGLFGIFGNKPLDFLCKWSKRQNATWLRCLFFPSCLNKLSAPRALSLFPFPFANHAMCPFQCFCLSTSVSVRVFCRHLRQTHSQVSLASAQCIAGSVGGGWCCSFPCCCCHA